jgi:predicted SnoaL-like aldol condensation-catalyzing enzyme
MISKYLPIALLGAVFSAIVSTASAAAPDTVRIIAGFHANWASDPTFINALSQDPNPRLAANKRLVLDFEAALERAQVAPTDGPGSFDQVVDQYLSPDYLQHDPSFPPGRDGILNFFKMVQKSGQRVSHPPVMVVAEGDIVVLTMMRPPVPDPDHPSKTYTAYRIAIWKVCGKKLCEHWGPGLKGKP